MSTAPNPLRSPFVDENGIVTRSGMQWLLSLFADNAKGNSGYLTIPGPQPILIQWGSFITVTGNLDVVTYPTKFPNMVSAIVVSEYNTAGWNTTDGPTIYGTARGATPTVSFEISCMNYNGGWAFRNGAGGNWIAIGY